MDFYARQLKKREIMQGCAFLDVIKLKFNFKPLFIPPKPSNFGIFGPKRDLVFSTENA